MARPRAAPPPAAPAARKPPGRVRRFFEGLDGISQLIDAVVAIGRLGGALLRGLGALLRIFD